MDVVIVTSACFAGQKILLEMIVNKSSRLHLRTARSRISKIEGRACVQQRLSGQHHYFCSLTISPPHRLTVLQYAIMNISNLCFTDPVFSLPCLALVGHCFSNGTTTNLSLRNQPFWCILTPPYRPFITGDSIRWLERVDSRATVDLGNQIGGAWSIG